MYPFLSWCAVSNRNSGSNRSPRSRAAEHKIAAREIGGRPAEEQAREQVDWAGFADAETGRRFLALASASYDAYYEFEETKGYNAFGPQLDAMLGLPPNVFERTYAAALQRIHPDDRERVDRLVDQSFRTGQPYVDQYRMRHESGSFIDVSDRGVILRDRDGGPLRMIGMIRDITPEITAARLARESEELYSSLFRSVQNPLLQLDINGTCTDVNAAAEQFLECSRDELVSRSAFEILTPSGDSTLSDLLRDVAAGRESRRVELEVPVKGAGRTALLAIAPCELRGEPVYFVVATDVTQMQEMSEVILRDEARLREQAEALSERNTALSVLLDQRQQERLDLEREVAANVQRFLLPVIDRLREAIGSRPEQVHVETLWRTVCDILRPVASKLDAAVGTGAPLTRRELEVLNLVRAGRTTKEIATALYLSQTTVAAHRRSIRRKLGLSRSGTHLNTFLATVADSDYWQSSPAVSAKRAGDTSSEVGEDS